MDWKQVCLTAQLFAAARHAPMSMHEPTLLMYRTNGHRLFMPSKLSILPNFNAEGSWYVRNTGLDGGPPVYFPPVDESGALMETLEIAWQTDRRCRGPDDWKPIYLKSLGDAARVGGWKG
jgi:hypothetical protein